ncbi:uncharacterized protein A4U43_C03F14650 [Asparagus officinalis]|uniref:Uncharacterized protein n=1 Tax=Asparagus officinalis TaxID=4686 RepID=A0A5P1FAZ5_ASPOF|nr:uncharacterized protein A4U43_C03F14650 [Asparagus officinalis]
MSTKVRHRHKSSSFNPAWCLRPPPVTVTTPRNTNICSGNKSPLTSTHGPKKSHRHRRQSPEGPEITVEPTSPRVGCMGQVRRRKAPSSATGSLHSSSSGSSSRSPSVSPQFSLMMLRKSSNSSVNTSLRSSPLSIESEFSLLMLTRGSLGRVLVEEMDPPRPVERKEMKSENSVSLWKRRCGGGKGLQLQMQSMEQISV